MGVGFKDVCYCLAPFDDGAEDLEVGRREYEKGKRKKQRSRGFDGLKEGIVKEEKEEMCMHLK